MPPISGNVTATSGSDCDDWDDLVELWMGRGSESARSDGVFESQLPNSSGYSSTTCLRENFQRRNLIPFELEKVSKVNRAAGKVSDQVAGDDRLPVFPFA